MRNLAPVFTFRDLFKKRATLAQKELIKEQRKKLRYVTTAERLDKPDKFSPKGSYLARKSVKKVTGKTVFIRTIDKQDWRINVHHVRAAKLRKEGKLGYGPRADERGIPKSVETLRLNQLKRA